MSRRYKTRRPIRSRGQRCERSFVPRLARAIRRHVTGTAEVRRRAAART